MNKAILIITDGIGYKEKTEYNAFYHAKKPTYDKLFETVPHSLVTTHSLSVGLPRGQMGNSEVGHMTIGAGRIMYQDLVKVSKAVEEETLKENPALKELLGSVERVHIAGLLSDGGVHSHIDHLVGLVEVAAAEGKQVFLHLFTDGRDVSPTSGPAYMAQIMERTAGKAKIATVGGRYYAMDRDKRWERVERAYRAIVEAAPVIGTAPVAYLEEQHNKEITDEFIEPVAFDGYEGLKDGDGFIMANFRSDRVREMSQLLGEPGFLPVQVPKKSLKLITMTQYNKEFSFPVMFPKESPENTLPETIAKAGLSQFHTAETEKYAHVTFFFNGGVEEPFENETRVLIPSPKVATYDLQPEMSADAVGDAVVKAVEEAYDFIVVNFANGDMVGHTGVFEAGIKAVEAVDRNLGRIFEAAEAKGYAVVLTSDHGNCEEMKGEKGETLTNHTVGDVFCFVKAPGVAEVKPGGLSNIAPTILKLMDQPIPAEMDEPLI